MNRELMAEVSDLIAFYDAHGWDWTLAVEFTIWRASAHRRCRTCGL